MVTHQINHIPSKRARSVELEDEGPQVTIQSLEEAREAVQACRRCPLYEYATQAVFGEGPEQAEIMFIGEQPGDREDLTGRPFVGPAGKVLDVAIGTAQIGRKQVYVTNAVKHFKFEPRGKKRIHSKPNTGEIKACRFWLDLEREFVKPKVVVALGATAAQSLLGRTAPISSTRGDPIRLDDGSWLFVTVHPSYLLRIPDRPMAEKERQRFIDDLRRVKQFSRDLPQ